MTTSQLLPPLSPDDLERLKASIVESGVQVAVVVDETGAIIDGHHRAMIADSLGIKYPTDVRDGLSAAEKRILAVELNVARRQLTDTQKVLLGRQIKPDIAAVAKQRQARPGAPRTSGSNIPNVGERTAVKVARAVGVGSSATYKRHKKVVQEAEEVAPELMPSVEEGEMKIIDLRQEVKRQKQHTTPAPSQPATLEVDPAVATQEVRRWLSQAHKTLSALRDMDARFSASVARGVEGEVLAHELDELATAFASFAEKIRAYGAGEEHARHGRATR